MSFKQGDKVRALLHGPGLSRCVGIGEVSRVNAGPHPTYVVRFDSGPVTVAEEWLEPVGEPAKKTKAEKAEERAEARAEAEAKADAKADAAEARQQAKEDAQDAAEAKKRKK